MNNPDRNRPLSWPDIVHDYRDIEKGVSPEKRASHHAFWRAYSAVGDLAAHIAEGPLGSSLFGWKSMHDLGIQQSDANTFSTSHLRVSPQLDGTVEFRYVDTHIASRQWSRTVPPEGVIGRFEAFLDQLHWVAR
jgi:hypothetical protein